MNVPQIFYKFILMRGLSSSYGRLMPNMCLIHVRSRTRVDYGLYPLEDQEKRLHKCKFYKKKFELFVNYKTRE